jgi:bacterioferritin-associated ferredoxin
MIVCICNNVNSDTIKSTLEKGVTTIQGIREETGATGCCGKCQFKVNGLINDHCSRHEISELARQEA